MHYWTELVFALGNLAQGGGGGDFNDLFPDVCVEGLEKDPF